MSELRDLRNVNLNLLPVLRELLRYGSVTEAAKALHLSQSSVSGSLKALREHFGDELIVTLGRQTALTAHARELVGPVDVALEALQSALFRRAFDPDEARARFYVATHDYVGAVIAPALAEVLQASFPGVSVQLVQLSLESFEGLETGEVDLIISAAQASDLVIEQLGLKARPFARQRLWFDELVGIARQGIEPPTTLEAFMARPHASFQLSPRMSTIDQRLMDQLDVVRNDRLLVPSFHLLPLTVSRSDCISVVPESLSQCYANVLPLTPFPLPFEAPAIHVEMMWMARDTDSPRQRWLRDTLRWVVAQTDYLPD